MIMIYSDRVKNSSEEWGIFYDKIKNLSMRRISIIIPTLNESSNIQLLIDRIEKTALLHNFTYEIIFVDDHSTDNTQRVINALSKPNISLYLKKRKKGKAQSLIEGFSYAKYDFICMIDADLQYPPEAIPAMMKLIDNGTADIVVANRKINNVSVLRKFISKTYLFFFGKAMLQFNCDVQSGLKVFRKEIVERLLLNPLPWAFDLEFLVKARNAGYIIASHNIKFSKRNAGSAKIRLLTASFQIGLTTLKLKLFRSDVIPFHPNTAKEKGEGFHYKGREFIHHSKLDHNKIAFFRFSGAQIVILLGLFIVLLEGLYINWHATVETVLILLTILYFADLLFNLYLVYRSFSQPAEIQISDDELIRINEKNLPVYTILCPLYKEWQVVPQFIKAMSGLDYPKNKLQVMLLLEENDKETLSQINKAHLPYYFDVVVVPHSMPKTKPKACNYGLLRAKGEYLVIYDAEDMPDPLQLKKAILAFHKADKRTKCIQAKLNFYNPHQNLLTRFFTAEYSLWFDLVLTGLQSIHAPIPLGGTSNHFRTKDLISMQGWDSFNVTEDCDLGMRLVKDGYRTAIIDSITLEEANSDLKNWFNQRTRWIKGYMQTYLLHMRNPKSFFRDRREPHGITFQLVVGGKVLSMFINPLMWIITISYFAFRAHIGTFIESFFPAPILYMGVFSLIIGNFLYCYNFMIGCEKHDYDDLVKYVFLVPFYWLAMSVAAWVAVYKLIKEPHHWSKTKHGFHLSSKNNYVTEKILNLRNNNNIPTKFAPALIHN